MIPINRGRYTEELFIASANARQWNATPATTEENIHHHIDYHITKNATTYRIDVKGMKSLERNAPIQDSWHTLELIAVVWPSYKNAQYTPPFDPLHPDFSAGSGRKGWLYGSADFIAFERKHMWIFVKPRTLVEWCAEHVDFDAVASNAKNAQYCVYSRPNRGDLFTYIPSSELERLSIARWTKQIV